MIGCIRCHGPLDSNHKCPICDVPLRERERRENAPYLAEAKATGKAVTFITSDGCEVTCLPDGSVLFNAADWF